MMRTNYVGFALVLGMGLVVVLVGLLALSAAGLTNLVPALAAAETEAPADTTQYVPFACGTDDLPPQATASYVPANAADAATIAAGDALFKNNCTQCHAVNEKVVGPALAGITKRRSIGWLVPWIHNSSKVVASGDEYAVKLYNDYGKQQMPSFPQLSKKDVEAIMTWVESQRGTSVPASAPIDVAALP